MNYSTLSPESETCSRSPEISSIAFHAQPSDLPPVSLMNMGFAIIGPLARHRRPLIRFLSISSRVCSTLPSDPASQRRPCVSLSLHLHQVVKRTLTSKLSNMLGVPKKRRGGHPPRREKSNLLPRTGSAMQIASRVGSSKGWCSRQSCCCSSARDSGLSRQSGSGSMR